MPFAIRDKVKKKLDDLEDQDIIERIEVSDQVSNLVAQYIGRQKKEGDLRLALDLRWVNEAIVEEKFPLPDIDETLAELRYASI